MSSSRLKALSAALLAFACVSAIPTVAQGPRERVIHRISQPDEPVDELEVEVGGRPVKLNSFFAAERDWLKGLKVKAKNVSGRPIIFADILLSIPERGTMELPLGVSIIYGKLPEAYTDPAPGQEAVAPGEVFQLKLSGDMFDGAMKFLADHKVTEVIEARITGMMIVFADGTAWNGRWLQRDLSHPWRWVPAKRSSATRTPGTFQKVGWQRPPGAFIRRAAIEEVLIQCHTHFSYDYSLCGTTTGNNACIVQDHRPRPQENDDIPAPRRYLSMRSELCQGANCASVTKMVGREDYNPLCSYSGGNEWQ